MPDVMDLVESLNEEELLKDFSVEDNSSEDEELSVDVKEDEPGAEKGQAEEEEPSAAGKKKSVGKAEEGAEKPTEAEKKGAERKVDERLKNIIDYIGKDATLKSKGLEVKIEEFTPEEVKTLTQKGLRFYQAMEELARERERLEEQKKLVEEALKRLETNRVPFSGHKPTEETQKTLSELDIPESILEISEDDDQETKALKRFLKGVAEELRSLKAERESVAVRAQQEALLKEIEKLKEEYPLVSPEEAIAVHFLSGGQIPLDKIAETSHRHYGSLEFIKKVFQINPEVKKAIRDEIIAEYLAQKNEAKKTMPVSRVSGARERAVELENKEEEKEITFDNAGRLVTKYLKSLREE